MTVGDPAPGRAHRAEHQVLNCGLIRERGIERTSTSRFTAACRSNEMNSAIVQVEWPIVKIVDIVRDCRTDFLPASSRETWDPSSVQKLGQ
jgi:hypothetical protein